MMSGAWSDEEEEGPGVDEPFSGETAMVGIANGAGWVSVSTCMAAETRREAEETRRCGAGGGEGRHDVGERVAHKRSTCLETQSETSGVPAVQGEAEGEEGTLSPHRSRQPTEREAKRSEIGNRYIYRSTLKTRQAEPGYYPLSLASSCAQLSTTARPHTD